MTTTEATTAASPVANADRERIAAIAEALTGERHEVTTEKRRGYWYARCGDHRSGKGTGGDHGESGAVRALLVVVVAEARSVARTLARKDETASVADAGIGYATQSVARARDVLTETERHLARRISDAATARAELDAARAAATERERAVFAALTGRSL